MFAQTKLLSLFEQAAVCFTLRKCSTLLQRSGQKLQDKASKLVFFNEGPLPTLSTKVDTDINSHDKMDLSFPLQTIKNWTVGRPGNEASRDTDRP